MFGGGAYLNFFSLLVLTINFVFSGYL